MWDRTEMEMNKLKTHNPNKNKNNNFEENEAEGETDMAARQPSPARSDGSIRSTRSSSLGLKAKTEKGPRLTPYEVREPKIVLKDIRKIDLDFNWIKRSANVEPSLGTDGEATTLSPGASVGSGRSTIYQREADTNTQTLQPPRYTSARTTGLVECSKGEKDKEEDTEAMDTDLEVMDMEVEQDPPDKKEKRGRGRPPTTYEHVGKREKDEERARQKKEEELEKRAKEALSSNPPQGRKWEKAQDEVKEIEEELSKAHIIMGPKVGGRAKPIPVEIPGMNEEEMQRYHILLEEMKSLQVTAAGRAQGNAIPSCSMARPIPAKRSLVTGGEIKTSLPQRTQKAEATPIGHHDHTSTLVIEEEARTSTPHRGDGATAGRLLSLQC